MTFLALQSLLSLLGIGLLYHLWQDYRTDAFRQDVFALRDRLFDQWCETDLSFDHPAYQMMRSTMNGYIRYAHRIRFFPTVLLGARVRRAGLEPAFAFDSHLEAAMQDLPDEIAGKVRTIRDAAHQTLALHVVLCSVFMTLLSAVLILLTLAKLGLAAAKSSAVASVGGRQASGIWDTAALAEGRMAAAA